MANVKITDLTEDTSPADNDWVETVDVSAGANKKVTRTNFFAAPPLADSVILPKHLVTGTGSTWAWTSYSPTFTNLTAGNGTVVAYWVQIGKTVFYQGSIVFGSTSSMGTSPRVSLPVNANAHYPTVSVATPIGNIRWEDSGVNAGTGQAVLNGASGVTTMAFEAANASSTYLLAAGITSTAPMTWGTSDILAWQVVYEAA